MLKSEARAKRHPTGKDKMALTDGPPPPPPMMSLSEDANRDEADHMEEWRRFKEVGLLDEAALERRDREVLLEKVQMLERELFRYQYKMDLLLIEKKEWTLKNEELQESLLDAHEILKREKTANLVAVSQVEEREANLRKSLVIERRRVSELERSFRELSSEHEKIKMMAFDGKPADANDLEASIQDRSLEVQQKLVAADSKLAEASPKSLVLERILQEVETRESVRKRERISYISKRDAYGATVLKHKDMLKWARKLQEGEERLSKNRRHIYDREEEVNDLNRMLKEREKELNKEQKKIELEKWILKKKEEDINRRLAELIEKEEKAESLSSSVKKRKKELIALTEKLSPRARSQALAGNPDELQGDEEYEEDNTVEVSMPRKIWTFFTS